MTTMSLRLSVGARQRLTYARNVFRLIAPSTTNDAFIPLRRRATTNVIVFVHAAHGRLSVRRVGNGRSAAPDLGALEETPDRTAATRNPVLMHRRNHFIQGQ